MSETPLVRTELQDGVLVITMCRVSKRNAVDRALADALDAAFNRMEDSPQVRAGVLTGGLQVFSAGSDLASRGDYFTERGGEYGIIRRRRAKPLIAAVEGAAFGGGMEIVLACEMVVAATDARFGLPEVMRGVLPTCGALFRALSAMPQNIARELVLTGEPIDAVRAHAFGLVNRLAEPGTALDEALLLARRIAANAPLAVQASLKAMNDWIGRDDDAGWAASAQAHSRISGSDDVREGIRAFFERRAPIWTGR